MEQDRQKGLMNGQPAPNQNGQAGLMSGQMPQGTVANMISNLFANGASMGGNVDSFMQTPFRQPGSAPPMEMTAGGMAPIGSNGAPMQDTGSVSHMNQQQQQAQALNPTEQINQWRAPPPGYGQSTGIQPDYSNMTIDQKIDKALADGDTQMYYMLQGQKANDQVSEWS